MDRGSKMKGHLSPSGEESGLFVDEFKAGPVHQEQYKAIKYIQSLNDQGTDLQTDDCLTSNVDIVADVVV